MLEGSLDLSMNHQDLLDKLRNLDLITKFDFREINTSFENQEADHMQRINLLEESRIEQLQLDLINRNELFIEKLVKLILPLRFSILTLISMKKVNIFSDEILEFMDCLLDWSLVFDGKEEFIFRRNINKHERDFFLIPGNESAHFDMRRVVYLLDAVAKDVRLKARPKPIDP